MPGARQATATGFYRLAKSNPRRKSHGGPLTLVDGEFADAAEAELAAAIVARFSQGRDAEAVSVQYNRPGGVSQLLTVKPLTTEQVPKDWYLG